MKNIKFFLPLLLTGLLLFSHCLTDEAVDLFEAYSEITSAIDYKEKDCGGKPEYPLILPGVPSEYGTRLCTVTIIRMECPFNDYPIFCLEMYSEVCDECDVPGIGP